MGSAKWSLVDVKVGRGLLGGVAVDVLSDLPLPVACWEGLPEGRAGSTSGGAIPDSGGGQALRDSSLFS